MMGPQQLVANLFLAVLMLIDLCFLGWIVLCLLCNCTCPPCMAQSAIRNSHSAFRNPHSLHIQIIYRTPHRYQIPPAYMRVYLRRPGAPVP